MFCFVSKNEYLRSKNTFRWNPNNKFQEKLSFRTKFNQPALYNNMQMFDSDRMYTFQKTSAKNEISTMESMRWFHMNFAIVYHESSNMKKWTLTKLVSTSKVFPKSTNSMIALLHGRFSWTVQRWYFLDLTFNAK